MRAGSPEVALETIAPDEEAVTTEFIAFMKEVSARRHPSGEMRRFNQPRAAGCVTGQLTVPDGLPPELRVGLFATPAAYPIFVRFANASSTSDRERDIRGMSIQVRDVSGDNLTEGAGSQDFILNSHPVMVAPDTAEFLALLRANEAGGFRRAWYFLTHLKAARIGLAARQRIGCHLDIPYWSTTPYLLGEGRAVKYLVRPTSGPTSPVPDDPTDTYLRDALAERLSAAAATFDLCVQLQTDPSRMPIEDASVEWDPDRSPFTPVAHIEIPSQAVDTADRRVDCEAVAFNPWHCLPAHRPLGNMNRARRRIYAEMAAYRADRNAGVRGPDA